MVSEGRAVPAPEAPLRLFLEPTGKKIVVVGPDGEVPARIWQGTTDRGVKVAVAITRLAVDKREDQVDFEAELDRVPFAMAGRTAIESFDLRMIL